MPLLYFTLFLSTPSARRATTIKNGRDQKNVISIHALREEGDWEEPKNIGRANKFLSTPSTRRATRRYSRA